MDKLDQYGKLVWIHKENKYLFAEKAYGWSQTILLIDESNPPDRTVVKVIPLSHFNESAWVPMTKEQFG